MNTICQVCETNTQEHDNTTTLITNDEITSLERCRSENDWWARVMLSGLMARVTRNFQ